MTFNQGSSLLIVAGEASSALYAQRLLEIFKNSNFEVDAFGVGNQEMEDLGFRRLGKSEEMAVVGLQEVIGEFRNIRKVFYNLLSEAKQKRPKCALLLDYPDFNLRLAKKLKAMGIPVVYFISPQLWAWRTGRVKQIQKNIDKMLVLFPFEETFYRKHQVNVKFVGHPILDELDDKYFDVGKIESLRKKHNLLTTTPLLGLMPGSRKSEIKHHLLTQIQMAEILGKEFPYLQFGLFLAPSLDESQVEDLIENSSTKISIIKDEPLNMISMADMILCASGTATLIVGLLEKPMVIMYKMNNFSAFMAKRLVTQVKFFGMPNLILDKEVAPECFQEEANPETLADQFKPWILSEENRRSKVEEMQELKPKLGQQGAMQRVFEELQEYF